MKRRALLAGASALPFGLPLSASATTSDPDWIEACCRLAGSGAFPDLLAAAAREALEARHGTETVSRLAGAAATWSPDAALTAELEPIAQELLAILYTGETSPFSPASPRDGAPFFAWALAWQSLGFAAAPSLCGGLFAAWSQA